MILVVALDGLDPDLVTRFRDQGGLPELGRLAESGIWGRLRSSFPPVSVPAWATFLCGTGPGRHGLYDFTRLEDGRVRFANAADRLVPSLPELLDGAGLRTCSIGIPTTYPVSQLRRGAMLSGFDSPFGANPDRRSLHPPSLWQEMRAAGVDLRATTLPQGRKGPGWHARARREIQSSIERRLAQGLAALARGPWDLLAVHFQAADTAGHHFFRYFDPEAPRHDARHPDRARVIPDVYDALDAALGRLRAAVPADTRCLVLSDHGMGPASRCVVHLNRWLELEGFLAFRPAPLAASLGHAVRRAAVRHLPHPWQARLFRWTRDRIASGLESAVRMGAIDLERSAAFSEESSTLPGIWLVDQTRRDDLLRRLRGWPAVRRVHRREDLYRGPALERAPHLLLELEHGLVRTPPGYRGEGVRRLAADELDGERGAGLNGLHRPEGWFAAGGWNDARGQVDGAWIGDLAPTLIASLGIEVPDWMEGRPLRALVSQNAAAPTSAAHRPAPAPSGGTLSPAESRRLERRLRTLGYLG